VSSDDSKFMNVNFKMSRTKHLVISWFRINFWVIDTL